MTPLEKFLADSKDDAEILERAGKAAVWEKLTLFFESDRFQGDDTAQFLLQWAHSKWETHGPFAAKAEAARSRVVKQAAIIRVMWEALAGMHDYQAHAIGDAPDTRYRTCSACNALDEADELAGEADGK